MITNFSWIQMVISESRGITGKVFSLRPQTSNSKSSSPDFTYIRQITSSPSGFIINGVYRDSLGKIHLEVTMDISSQGVLKYTENHVAQNKIYSAVLSNGSVQFKDKILESNDLVLVSTNIPYYIASQVQGTTNQQDICVTMADPILQELRSIQIQVHTSEEIIIEYNELNGSKCFLYFDKNPLRLKRWEGLMLPNIYFHDSWQKFYGRMEFSK